MALVVLLALLGTGLAHASRLCGIDRHGATVAAASMRCAAHHDAESAAAAQPAAAGHGAPTPASAPTHQREPSCCAAGSSLAALPGARAEIARHGSIATFAPAAATGRLGFAAQRCIAHVACAARDPGSGPRRHLVHRILLI